MTKVAIVDIDGTLLKEQIQKDFINFLYKNDEVNTAYLLRINIWFILYKLRLVHDIKNVLRKALDFIKGKKVEDIEMLVSNYSQYRLPKIIYPKAFSFIERLRNDGYTVILLSTAVDVLVRGTSNLFKADDYISTRLEVNNGCYTGSIIDKIVYGEEKLSKIKEYFALKNYRLESSIAFGDHESDIPLLKAVSKGYICNPNTHMRSLAMKEKIDIISLN
jgi:HAD superfamily hydrolase (TIGR01490 family)